MGARRRALALLGAIAVTLGMLLGGLTAQAAMVQVPETGQHGRLVLSSDHPGYLELTPGVPAYWRVDAWLVGADEATLALELYAVGSLVEHPDGLSFGVDRCSAVWQVDTGAPPHCPGLLEAVAVRGPGSATMLPGEPLPTAREPRPDHDLRRLAAGETAHLLVTLLVDPDGVAHDDPSLMGLSGELGLGLTAAGVDPDRRQPPADPSEPPGPAGQPGAPDPPDGSAPPDASDPGGASEPGAPADPAARGPRLPRTGVDPLLQILVAGGLTVLGVALLRTAARAR